MKDHCSFSLLVYRKVTNCCLSWLVAIWCLCTVTFDQKVPKLNSRPVFCSHFYGMQCLEVGFQLSIQQWIHYSRWSKWIACKMGIFILFVLVGRILSVITLMRQILEFCLELWCFTWFRCWFWKIINVIRQDFVNAHICVVQKEDLCNKSQKRKHSFIFDDKVAGTLFHLK